MMKSFFLALAVLVAAATASLEELHTTQFQAFKAEHGKSYQNQVEETARYNIFLNNVREIEEHNARYEQGLETYTKAINQFSDWTQEEFKSYLTLHAKPAAPENTTEYIKTGVEVPSSIDWRTQGYVTGVKNQGQCGSCWAFSVTGAMEGAYFKKSGNLVSFSEQQLVDCTTSFNYGCDGGWMELVYPYIAEYGIETESAYPYTAKDGSCKYDASKIVTKISSYRNTHDEAALLEAVGTLGPVSVSMDASYISSYSSGIFSSTKCDITNLNHGVLVVGYGSENGVDYWIIKNSWGSSWGDNGYLKLRRGTNECGVSEDDSYPLIN
ncbi:hypothetical protein ABEB36_003928 [Hypothenemus hampei]|uniref:Uncharacterized protein n=1 Tax=Hypothenemus hampei TaxID=57062 RepID=A0ABD1F4Q7_HYPHA